MNKDDINNNINRLLKFFIIVVLGIAVNIFGSLLVEKLGIPIYLDSVGTVVTTVMSGYLPGIIVGLFTNLIKGFFVADSIYYSIISVLIAIIVYRFYRRGLLEKIYGYIVLIFVLAFVGGISGTLMSAVFGENEKIVLDFSNLPGDLIHDFIDKCITIGILAVLRYVLPADFRNRMMIKGWQQTPLSLEEMRRVKKRKNRGVSLRTKILMLLVCACISIGSVAMIISVYLYRENIIDEHVKLAQGITKSIKGIIDPEKIDEFMEKGEEAEGYSETENLLYHIHDSSPDIEYIYVYKILEDGCHVVFDLDTDEVKGEEAGTVIPFDESFLDAVPDLLAGKEIETRISNDTYGWLITVYEPLYDKTGKCVCYVAADISMKTIKENEFRFLVKLMSLFLGFFILVLAIGHWVSEYNVIIPVNTMSLSASAFAYNDEEALEENVEKIKKLNIHTGDEIENLYQAFTKTTENNMQYANDLQTKTETISKMQDALIMVLADMVENRDEETGDHVRKTAAYTRIIMDKMRELGYYTDQLTDDFIYNVEHSAPLHDIGKISVPDAILNKPGPARLTDEEFEIMKTHTIAGSKIIEQAMETVPESGYLKEAKNLAESHHEKWNGKGYPHGLAGEAIPLSARIMAVADVFDALVSERCYKKAFPFEKAMSIIKEDAGSHFDPKVADAFLQSADKVREVAEDFKNYSVKKKEKH